MRKYRMLTPAQRKAMHVKMNKNKSKTLEFDKALTQAEKLREQESRAKKFGDTIELRKLYAKSDKVNARVYQLAKELGMRE